MTETEPVHKMIIKFLSPVNATTRLNITDV